MSTEPEPVSDERLRQAVRDVLAEELDQNGDQPNATRRQVLGSIAAGGVLGGLAGAGSAAGATSDEDTSAMVGSLAGPPYKVADPGLFSGPKSSASSISNSVGQVHLAQDTGETLYDDGSSFSPLDRAAPNVQSKQRPVVDVTHPDFGAVGDGSTNDQPAFQDALDYASANAPAVVYVPPGRYVIEDPPTSGTSAMRWTDDVVLAGSGMFSTIIEDRFSQGGSTATGEPRFIYAGGTDTTQGGRVGVRNLGIENVSGFDANTISLEEFDEGFVENVFIDNTANSDPAGLPIALGFDEQAIVNRNGWVSGCIVRNKIPNNKSIQVSGMRQAAVTDNLIEGFNDPNGIAVVSNHRVTVADNVVDVSPATTAPGIQVLGSRNVNVTGNYVLGGDGNVVIGGSRGFDAERVNVVGNSLEDSVSDGIRADSPVKFCVINSNRIWEPAQDGLSFADQYKGQFIGNYIERPGRYGINNNRGAQEVATSVFALNTINIPASTGINIAEPTFDGCIIGLNQITGIGDGGPHIEILDPNANGPSDYLIIGNNCQRGGTGIVENGTPSDQLVTANNNP